MRQKKLYILIDETLEPIYGCVQGGHAVAQWLLEHNSQCWNNGYLIYLKCNVKKWQEHLNILKKDYTVFKEPDLGNRVTSLALLDDGKLFKKLKLISTS